MDQIRNFADGRLVNGCIYCGGVDESRDHVPSRVFLDSPAPENLPVVGACVSCNNGFSQDEEYVASLIESVKSGTTNIAHIEREKIAEIFRRSPALQTRIEKAKNLVGDQIQFNVEPDRIRNVVLKLARGHAAFELSRSCRGEPSSIWWCPLSLLDEDDKELFEASHVPQLLGEIGSRGSQRLFIAELTLVGPGGEIRKDGLPFIDWVDVQTGRYRYLAFDDQDGIRIRIVIAEYLAAEVVWHAETR